MEILKTKNRKVEQNTYCTIKNWHFVDDAFSERYCMQSTYSDF
jgi:hypothetical protein